MTADPAKLQEAIDSAFKDVVSAQFHMLVENVVEAHAKHPPGEPIKPLTENEATVAFINMIRLAWSLYQEACKLTEGITDNGQENKKA
jgi:hypothetical protein